MHISEANSIAMTASVKRHDDEFHAGSVDTLKARGHTGFHSVSHSPEEVVALINDGEHEVDATRKETSLCKRVTSECGRSVRYCSMVVASTTALDKVLMGVGGAFIGLGSALPFLSPDGKDGKLSDGAEVGLVLIGFGLMIEMIVLALHAESKSTGKQKTSQEPSKEVSDPTVDGRIAVGNSTYIHDDHQGVQPENVCNITDNILHTFTAGLDSIPFADADKEEPEIADESAGQSGVHQKKKVRFQEGMVSFENMENKRPHTEQSPLLSGLKITVVDVHE